MMCSRYFKINTQLQHRCDHWPHESPYAKLNESWIVLNTEATHRAQFFIRHSFIHCFGFGCCYQYLSFCQFSAWFSFHIEMFHTELWTSVWLYIAIHLYINTAHIIFLCTKFATINSFSFLRLLLLLIFVLLYYFVVMVVVVAVFILLPKSQWDSYMHTFVSYTGSSYIVVLLLYIPKV